MHRLTLVTRNVHDVEPMRVPAPSPFRRLPAESAMTGARPLGRTPDPSLMQGIEAGAALTPGGFPPKRPDHFSRRTAPLEAGATTGPDADARARVFFRTRRVP